MKFAKRLADEDGNPELHALYKQLKKSLRIFEGPADAGSTVEAGLLPHMLPSSDDEEDEEDAAMQHAPAAAAAAAAPPAAAAPRAGAAAACPTCQQQQQQQQGGSTEVAMAAAAPADAQQQHYQQQQQQQQQQEQQQQQPDAEQEARFVALVEQCVGQLNEDYLAREEVLVIKADIAQQAAATAASREEQLEAYRSVVNVHGELVLLCHWSMVAYTGLVKILKKHFKRTGQRVRSALLANLLSQPFCSLEEVRGLVRAAEQQIAALAAALGMPASQAPTAGAAAAAAVRDPAAQPQPTEALARGSPAVGESGGAVIGQPWDVFQQQQAQQAAAQRQAALQQLQPRLPQQQEWEHGWEAELAAAAEVAAQQPAVEVVAACWAGSAQQLAAGQGREQQQGLGQEGRPVLKRDRSKVYAPSAKRQERPGSGGMWAKDPQPASSGGSSMQMSAASEGGTPRAHGEAAPASGGGGEDGLDPHQRRTIMQRTKAALQLWKALRSNASTPSTVAASQPPIEPAGSPMDPHA